MKAFGASPAQERSGAERSGAGRVIINSGLCISHPEVFTFYGYINQTQESNLVSLPEFIVAETTFTLMWSKNREKSLTR